MSNLEFVFDDLYATPSRRRTFAGGPLNRTTRSWTNNGVQYHVQTTSMTSPSFSFAMMGGTAGNQSQPVFGQVQHPERSQGTGLIGTAFNLFGSMLAARQAAEAQRNVRRTARQPNANNSAYGEDSDGAQSKTLYSNFPGRGGTGSQRTRRTNYDRTQSPPRSRPHGGESYRTRSYRAEQRDPPWAQDRAAYVEDSDDEEDSDEDSDEGEEVPQNFRRAFTQNDASMIAALQNAVQHHRQEAKKCRDRIQRISSQPAASTEVLQRLVNDLREHERAYENARENLKAIRDRASGSSQPNDRTRTRFAANTEFFAGPSRNDFESSFFQSRMPRRSMFDDDPMFETFRSFFNDGGMPGFFPTPGATFNHSSNQQPRPAPQPQPPRAFQAFTAPQPTPPANLLKPEEAKLLFKRYNERWNSLGQADPDVPYPARELHPNNLIARDSIWAPTVTSRIAEWSDEVIMQANTQAFFLGAVGLSPQYSEAPGTRRIVMGYTKANANPTQVKQLVDILKKEKARWHSDRLGRRNAGMTGPNEALQRNEKARAVFHAVCELMEVAHGA